MIRRPMNMTNVPMTRTMGMRSMVDSPSHPDLTVIVEGDLIHVRVVAHEESGSTDATGGSPQP
tara:strand:- start:1 stop:189 length:189 start_codon:yes stop_codon:yes gene_type:complete